MRKPNRDDQCACSCAGVGAATDTSLLWIWENWLINSLDLLISQGNYLGSPGTPAETRSRNSSNSRLVSKLSETRTNGDAICIATLQHNNLVDYSKKKSQIDISQRKQCHQNNWELTKPPKCLSGLRRNWHITTGDSPMVKISNQRCCTECCGSTQIQQCG